ncbi:hypothetical protein HPB47_012569 [Ixodes persulcatus]|uniref:Uncharacterized protein n=1 Tax=Ixodes persulcatus TaxID=34615 RepID=A0AC60NTA8_IXOPE|nr:hypothetical protein HPB47_012569 [Ixodes persulcatus]
MIKDLYESVEAYRHLVLVAACSLDASFDPHDGWHCSRSCGVHETSSPSLGRDADAAAVEAPSSASGSGGDGTGCPSPTTPAPQMDGRSACRECARHVMDRCLPP